jgi:opacity protein-like surface antigen
MRSLKIFALAAAGLAVLATGHARAADLPPMLPPPPMIQEYGGWYLRGDIGMTNQKVRRLDNVLFANNGDLVSSRQEFRERHLRSALVSAIGTTAGFAGTSSANIAVKPASTLSIRWTTADPDRDSTTIRQRSPNGC